jgi:hypothetical protein
MIDSPSWLNAKAAFFAGDAAEARAPGHEPLRHRTNSPKHHRQRRRHRQHPRRWLYPNRSRLALRKLRTPGRYERRATAPSAGSTARENSIRLSKVVVAPKPTQCLFCGFSQHDKAVNTRVDLKRSIDAQALRVLNLVKTVCAQRCGVK